MLYCRLFCLLNVGFTFCININGRSRVNFYLHNNVSTAKKNHAVTMAIEQPMLE
jgi:hypothetical protein